MGNLSGKIALVWRGGCALVTKEIRGAFIGDAKGIVLVDNRSGEANDLPLDIPAGTVADLVTQQQSVTKSALAQMPSVATAIFVPYNSTSLTLKITSGDQSLLDVPLVALEAVEQAGVLSRAWDAVRLWIK